MSITNDLALSPHDRRSASQPPRRESATSNATRTRPHTVSAETSHTYAQRHADAGVPVDVLRELLDHDAMDTTRIYYRVGAQRQRDAVDKVTRHQFDRDGKHIWRQAQALLDAEHARRAVGQVAVP
jgi:integrase